MIGLKELLGLVASALFLLSSVMVPGGDQSLVAVDRLDGDGVEAVAGSPVAIEVDGLTVYEPVLSEGSSLAPTTVEGTIEHVQGIASTMERPATVTFGGERLEVPPGSTLKVDNIAGTVSLQEAPVGAQLTIDGTATDLSIEPPKQPVVSTHGSQATPLPVAGVSLGERNPAAGLETGGSYDQVTVHLAEDIDPVDLTVGASTIPVGAGATIVLEDYVGFVALVGADAPHDRLHLEGYAAATIGDEAIEEDASVSATAPLPQGPGATEEPNASFSYTPEIPATGEGVDFEDASEHDAALRSWEWDFGDGTTSAERNPTHAFSAPGSYEVELTVTDAEGQADTHTDEVTVANTPPEIEASWAPLTPKETELVTFEANATDRDGNLETVHWSFPDGSTVDGSTVEHRFSELGEYEVTATAIDEGGLEASLNETIHVQNHPPNASFEVSPSTPVSGETATLTSTTETFGTGDVVEHEWDVDGLEETLTGETVDVAFPDYGDLKVSLTVTDEHGDQAIEERFVYVQPSPPEVAIDVDDTYPNPDQVVTFSASIESATHAEEATWTLPNGAQVDGLSLEHAFDEPGDHTIQVNVTDDEGLTGEALTTITVNHPPEVTLTVPEEGEVEETARSTGDPLTVEADVLDEDGNETEDVWLVKDLESGVTVNATEDTACEVGTDPLTLECTWEEKGLFRILLASEDDNGARVTGSLEVAVLAEPPTVLGVTPDTVQAGVEAELTVEIDDPDNATEEIRWYADTLIGKGKTILHTFDDPGVKEILVELLFHDGEQMRNVTGSVEVEVNEAPTVSIQISPGTTVETGETVTFEAVAEDPDGPDSSLTYAWELGDGTTKGNLTSVTHAYDEDGSYEASVTVTDPQGGQGADSVTVKVTLPELEASITASPSQPHQGEEVLLEVEYEGDRDVEQVEWSIDGEQETTSDATLTTTFEEPRHVGISAKLETTDGATDQAFTTLRVTAAYAHELAFEPELPDGSCPVPDATFAFNFTNQFTGYSVQMEGGEDQWTTSECTLTASIPESHWSIGDGYRVVGACLGTETVQFGDFNLNGTLEDRFMLTQAPLRLDEVGVTDREHEPLVVEGSNDSTTYHDPLESVHVAGQALWCAGSPVLDWTISLTATYSGPRDVLGGAALDYFQWSASTNANGVFHEEVPAPVLDVSAEGVQVTQPGGDTSLAYLPGQYAVTVSTSSPADADQERATFIEDPEGIFQALRERGLVI